SPGGRGAAANLRSSPPKPASPWLGARGTLKIVHRRNLESAFRDFPFCVRARTAAYFRNFRQIQDFSNTWSMRLNFVQCELALSFPPRAPEAAVFSHTLIHSDRGYRHENVRIPPNRAAPAR